MINNSTSSAPPVKRPRIFSIDIVRGLAIAFMALDHTRDFFSSARFSVTDLSVAGPGLFLSRWITHYCAPAFVLLAGTSAFLFRTRGKRTKADLAFFLLTRGAWLILLEFTLVHWGWSFNFSYYYVACQVIWVIGCSMIALAGLIYLPTWMILLISITMIAGHNLLDGIKPDSFGRFAWLWRILHVPGLVQPFRNVYVKVLYTLIPWIGVMGLGYGIGPMFLKEQVERKKQFLTLGIALILAFIFIRATNIYGDFYTWSTERNALYGFFSFINCTKYPPSFLFLLITLGPVFILLSLFDTNEIGPLRRILLTYGRVPLFFYILHLPLIHGMAVIFALFKYGYAQWLFKHNTVFLNVEAFPDTPGDYGYGLAVVYMVWLSVLVILFPLCRWFMNVKKNHPQNILLSYL